MSAVMFVFAFIWLIAGLIEWETAITHAKQYQYPPITYAAKYWLCASVIGFLIGIYTS